MGCTMARKQRLGQDRLDMLLQIPSVAEKIQASSDPWLTKHELLLEWLNAHHGSFPKRGTSSPEEKRLAIWLNDQCTMARKQRLGQDRLDMLLQIPGVAERIHH